MVTGMERDGSLMRRRAKQVLEVVGRQSYKGSSRGSGPVWRALTPLRVRAGLRLDSEPLHEPEEGALVLEAGPSMLSTP